MTISRRAAAALALVVFAGACESYGDPDRNRPCAALEEQCAAKCEHDFENDPDSWAWRSCLDSCKPSEGAICH